MVSVEKPDATTSGFLLLLLTPILGDKYKRDRGGLSHPSLKIIRIFIEVEGNIFVSIFDFLELFRFRLSLFFDVFELIVVHILLGLSELPPRIINFSKFGVG